MKRRLILISFLIVLILGASIGFISFNKPKTIIAPVEKAPIEVKVNYTNEINTLKAKYNNLDVIAYIEIPGVLKEAIAQTTNNDYYLHYDLEKNENIIGATFLDYRTKIDESKKLLVYSHSDPEGTLPFVKLTNYNDKKFFL